MRHGYKIFFQGAGWSIFTVIGMGCAVRGEFWIAVIFGAIALALMWFGLDNAEKVREHRL